MKDEWVRIYNEEGVHSGKHCFGKTPMETLADSMHLAFDKQLDRAQNSAGLN